MPLPVLICDDSALARKAIARSLPKDWDISISFAENGKLGIEAIKDGKADVLFLDLNMPVMDGYQVLETIVKEDLPSLVIVISGDIQPQAHKRVKALGALDFIKKPIEKNGLITLLSSYGIYKAGEHHSLQGDVNKGKDNADKNVETEQISLQEALQEVSNIAMGRTGDLLARLLDVFVDLPIPKVSTLNSSNFDARLSKITNDDKVSAVSQGFISTGIQGEAFIIFYDTCFKTIANLLNYQAPIDDHIEIEVMNDISNILIVSFLNALAEQLDIHFSQGQPDVLGQHDHITQLINYKQNHGQKTLTIEVNYAIKAYNIKCDLLVVFTQDSIKTLNHKIGYLL